MSENKILANEVETWAGDEMGFSSVVRSNKKDVQTDLLPICKGTAMINLWKEVTAVVKSKKSVDKIHKNLMLENLMAEAMKNYSVVEDNLRESTALDKEIESLELQLHGYKEDLQNVDLKIHAAKEDVKLLQIKGCLHRNSTSYLKHKNSGLKSFQKWIGEICETYYKRDKAFNKSTNTDSETCSQELSRLISKLENKLKSSVFDSTNNPEEFDNKWCLIRDLIKRFTPDVIALSFQQLVEISTSTLADEEKRINFDKELDDLKAKHQIEDGAGGQNALATVQNMLQNWELECVNIFSQCISSKQNAENMLLQVDAERSDIVQIFQTEYSLSPTILQLLIDELDARIEFASIQGCLRSFQASFARLHHDIQVKAEEHNQLVKLKNEIDGFSENLAVYQKNILAITKHNSTVKSKLKERQIEVSNKAKNCIVEKQQHLSQNCSDVLTVIHNCSSTLGHVDVSKTRTIALENSHSFPICKLGIYTSYSSSYQKCGHSLRFFGHRAPTSLLRRIADTKHEISLSKAIEKENFGYSTNLTETCQHLNNLAKKVEEISDDNTELIRKKYKTGLEVTKLVLTKSQKLETRIKSWYEQPAQYQTPWLKANGMTWEEYRNKLEKI